MTSADSCRMGGIENVETVEDGPDSVLMPMCGSPGGRGDLWELNGLPWRHFVEKQYGGRRGRDRRPDIVGKGGEGGGDPQTEPLILPLVWKSPYNGK